jgi:bacterioferritin-associated ferredoxin
MKVIIIVTTEAKMIVCLCHHVNDKALDTVVANGASTLRDVGEACGAGTDCGQCCRDILKTLRKRQSVRPLAHDTAPLSK